MKNEKRSETNLEHIPEQTEGAGRLSSFPPIFDTNSRVLILGTMPSPASLRAEMYYSHPQNAFWRIMADLTADDPGKTNEEKRAFLLRHKIALWDTLESCVRPSAADSDISSAIPNDIRGLLEMAPRICAVFLNGGAAELYYRRYQKNVLLPSYKMPSTSPANARLSYAQKLSGWKLLQKFL